VTTPAPPTPPGPAVPAVPDPPALPGLPEVPAPPSVDSGAVTGVVGPLPNVPEVAPPEPVLPDLPAVPDVPTPLERVLDLGATPTTDAPAPANAPDRAPSTLLSEPTASRLDPRDAVGMLVAVDVALAPARGPPPELPGPPHPCPGGGTPHPTRTDPAAFLDPATDDASRRAESLAEARAYASTSLRDPLLRPD
jgi:hypothetical protein